MNTCCINSILVFLCLNLHSFIEVAWMDNVCNIKRNWADTELICLLIILISFPIYELLGLGDALSVSYIKYCILPFPIENKTGMFAPIYTVMHKMYFLCILKNCLTLLVEIAVYYVAFSVRNSFGENSARFLLLHFNKHSNLSYFSYSYC